MIRTQREIREARHPLQSLSPSDKLMMRATQSRDWAQDNQRLIYIFLGVIVAIVAGLFYYSNLRQQNNDRANTLLSRVAPIYFSGDYRRAVDGDAAHKIQGEPIQGLRKIYEEYGSSNVGAQTALYLGNAYYYLGKYDSAATMFDKGSSDYALMQSSFEAGRAAVAEEKRNNDEAAKLFQSAAKRDKNNPLNADYTLEAARDLALAGKKDDAIRLYKQVLGDYPNTQFDDAAKRALLKLNVPL